MDVDKSYSQTKSINGMIMKREEGAIFSAWISVSSPLLSSFFFCRRLFVYFEAHAPRLFYIIIWFIGRSIVWSVGPLVSQSDASSVRWSVHQICWISADFESLLMPNLLKKAELPTACAQKYSREFCVDLQFADSLLRTKPSPFVGSLASLSICLLELENGKTNILDAAVVCVCGCLVCKGEKRG